MDDPSKIAKWGLIVIGGLFAALLAVTFFGVNWDSEGPTPLSEMTVEQLYVLVIIAALLCRK